MSEVVTVIKIDNGQMIEGLIKAEALLETVNGCISLDLSSVRQIDANAVGALKQFGDVVQDRGAKVLLCGVEAGVYKVLKLVKLTSRFSVVN